MMPTKTRPDTVASNTTATTPSAGQGSTCEELTEATITRPCDPQPSRADQLATSTARPCSHRRSHGSSSVPGFVCDDCGALWRPRDADTKSPPAAHQSRSASLALLTSPGTFEQLDAHELGLTCRELAEEVLCRARRILDGRRVIGWDVELRSLLRSGELLIQAAHQLDELGMFRPEDIPFDASDYERPLKPLPPPGDGGASRAVGNTGSTPGHRPSAAPGSDNAHGARAPESPPTLGGVTTPGAADSLPDFAGRRGRDSCVGCGAPTVALYCAACAEGRR